MKLAEISKFHDGTIVIKYTNGYRFEGYCDDNNNPNSGVLTTPDGVKYNIPDFNGEDIYNVFAMIKRGELRQYVVKET